MKVSLKVPYKHSKAANRSILVLHMKDMTNQSKIPVKK